MISPIISAVSIVSLLNFLVSSDSRFNSTFVNATLKLEDTANDNHTNYQPHSIRDVSPDNNGIEAASLTEDSSEVEEIDSFQHRPNSHCENCLVKRRRPLHYHQRPFTKYSSSYIQPVYTRVKLGYGSSSYNGHHAELRCHFPYNLHLISNFVWNKVTDNIVHYLDSYRISESSRGHVTSLYINGVMPKDFGVYSCAVTGSFYGGYPTTFYQEVNFFPPANIPYRKWK